MTIFNPIAYGELALECLEMNTKYTVRPLELRRSLVVNIQMEALHYFLLYNIEEKKQAGGPKNFFGETISHILLTLLK